MVGAADGNQLPEHFDAVYQELTQAQQDELLAEATKMAEQNQQALAIAKELQARKK
jgi:fatty acid-binding protein DegV